MEIARKSAVRRACVARLFVGAAAALLGPGIAGAQSISTVDATRLSCRALQDIIQDRGAVIVRSRSLFSNIRLSDRYVSGRRSCFQNEVVGYRSVATADRDECPVKLCTERPESRSGP